jgi:diaminohydroxyphosphoribosylaminopyrimidine deaminase/5-amino-6-(5-phosphoribosylamino)uracil reductase
MAKGHHRRAGLPHAEIEAMARAVDLKGATLYVTLEPCCHTGKRTPPCTESIIGSGIRRVVVGTTDPNPKVSGRGLKRLRKAGIKTEVGVLREECAELNRFYNHWIRKQTPYAILKSAVSLDGRVALKNGVSKWITGPSARARVHELRAEVDAILVGIGTVLADDPELTARISTAKRQPARLVLDPHFKISPRARLFRSKPRAPVYIFISRRSFQAAKAKKLEKLGAGVVVFPADSRGIFDLKKLLRQIGGWGLTSLLVEGGPIVWTEFFRKNCFEECWVFVAPKILGADGKPFLGRLGLKKIPARPSLVLWNVESLGDDLLLRYQALHLQPRPFGLAREQ